MSEMSSIGTTPASRVDATSREQARTERAASGGARTERGEDRVEVSNLARFLQQIREAPEVREDLVNRVRSEIDAGTYLNSDRLDAAAENLIQEESAIDEG